MTGITKRTILTVVFTVAIAVGAALTACNPRNSQSSNGAAKKYVIAWSHYTSWEVFQFLGGSGLIDKWSKHHGVDVQFRLINDYVESLTLYSAGNFDGILATNVDALSVPGVSGVRSKAILVTSYSDGNDGLVGKGIGSFSDLKGKTVLIVEYSISHYLLSRALAENGMSFKDVSLANASESDIDAVFLNRKPPVAIATWNPILVEVKKTPGAQLLFDSSKIHGEIVEMLFVRPEVPDSVCAAILDAWYEAMAILTGPDNPERKKMLEALARSAGSSMDAYLEQLKTTGLFSTPADGRRFLEDTSFAKTMDRVRSFAFDAGMYGDASKSKDVVGMRLPDGSILGDKSKIILEFDTSHLKSAEAR